jgi:hypothetical protein
MPTYQKQQAESGLVSNQLLVLWAEHRQKVYCPLSNYFIYNTPITTHFIESFTFITARGQLFPQNYQPVHKFAWGRREQWNMSVSVISVLQPKPNSKTGT